VGTNKKLKITIETERTLIVRRREGAVRAWCMRCAALAEFVPFAEACALTGYSDSTVYKLMEDQIIHSIRDPRGLPLACLQSALEQHCPHPD
jgi:predicted DNA-binding transcriptional regulator AlpA